MSKRRVCKKCPFFVFRQCFAYPQGDYVCFSGFSPSDSCVEMCFRNLKVRGMTLEDLHKPLQLYFFDFI